MVGRRTGLLFLLLVVAAVGGLGAWSATRGVGTVVVPAAAPVPPSPTAAEPPPPATASSTPSATPSPSPSQVVVHVVGAVATPGVVALAPGARVQDALDAAGGPLPEADLRTVNLARPVQDGEQIPVPLPGETLTPAAPPAPVAPATTVPPGGSPTEAAGGQVNINTASEAELETLPGVGPVLAGRIVQWRTENGSFLTVDDLGEVQGIGDKVLANLRPHVTV